MGNLLIVAYKFPPMHSTSCVRTWGLYTHAREHFDSVIVLSTTNRHILRQEPVEMDGVEIYDAKTRDYRTVLQANKDRQSTLKDNTKESALGLFAQKLSASFPTLYLFGEGGLKYINSAVKIGKRIVERDNITHIFSTFSPYADHVIAHKLKRACPHLYWIADFRDLHVDPTQKNMLWRSYQERMNAKILARADLVTTVSEGLAVHLRKYHPLVHVMRNGIDILPDDKLPEPYGRFTISYTGSMYGTRREPTPLLEVLSDMVDDGSIAADELEIVYAGKDSDAWRSRIQQYDLEECFDDRGLVSRSEALDIQCRSHINLLLTYSSDDLTGNITGKIFEYFAARRPVLVLINGPKDVEIEELVEKQGGVAAYNNDIDVIRKFVMDKYSVFKSGDNAHIEGDLERFSWARLTSELMEKIADEG